MRGKEVKEPRGHYVVYIIPNNDDWSSRKEE